MLGHTRSAVAALQQCVQRREDVSMRRSEVFVACTRLAGPSSQFSRCSRKISRSQLRSCLTRRADGMRKTLALLLISLGVLPPQAFGQPDGFLTGAQNPLPGVITVSADQSPAIPRVGASVRPRTLQDAINREAARLTQSAAPSPSQPVPSRSWLARHPVLLGTLIGTGIGAAIDSGTCGLRYGGCGILWGGMGAGAFTGLLVSARPKPGFTAGPASSPPDVPKAALSSNPPDVLAVERVVRALGVTERIVVTDANGRQIRGSIQSIGQDRFVVVPDRQPTPVELAFSEVRDVRKGPLGAGARIGIAAGVIGILLTVLAIASCNSPNGICQ